MSGSSYFFDKPMTLGDLRRLTDGFPDELVVHVPSMNRCPGEFITADHLFICVRDNELSIDGDIAEARRKP